MATIKSYSDLQQSRKLAEILPLESADCFWDYDEMQKYHRISWFEDGYDKDSQLRLDKNNICAWSLAALLNVLPEYHLSSPNPLEKQYCCRVKDIETYSNNPVDTCVEMIIKLNELKML